MSEHETVDEMLDAYEEAAGIGARSRMGPTLEEVRKEVQDYIEQLEDTIFDQQAELWKYWQKDDEDMDEARFVKEDDLLKELLDE
jgi:hypothetical protein